MLHSKPSAAKYSSAGVAGNMEIQSALSISSMDVVEMAALRHSQF